MTNSRAITWACAIRNLGDERAPSAAVREERLRATAGLRPGALRLSAWRGRSGRRYVVLVHAIDEAALVDAAGAVVLAVVREDDGRARPVAVAAAEPDSPSAERARWLREACARGATELHVHRLVDERSERRTVVADLTGMDPGR